MHGAAKCVDAREYLVGVVLLWSAVSPLNLTGQEVSQVSDSRFQISSWSRAGSTGGAPMHGAYILDSKTGKIWAIVNDNEPRELGAIETDDLSALRSSGTRESSEDATKSTGYTSVRTLLSSQEQELSRRSRELQAKIMEFKRNNPSLIWIDGGPPDPYAHSYSTVSSKLASTRSELAKLSSERERLEQATKDSDPSAATLDLQKLKARSEDLKEHELALTKLAEKYKTKSRTQQSMLSELRVMQADFEAVERLANAYAETIARLADRQSANEMKADATDKREPE